jgi:hypothetical protein
MSLKSEIEKKGLYYQEAMKKWERRVLIISFFLFLFILGLFVLQLGLCKWKFELLSFGFSFYIRFILTSPIIFYLGFCVKQFEKNRNIFNSYNYKSTIISFLREKKGLISSQNELNVLGTF